MLGQRCRQWTSIDSTLVRCLVFAGLQPDPKAYEYFSTFNILYCWNASIYFYLKITQAFSLKKVQGAIRESIRN